MNPKLNPCSRCSSSDISIINRVDELALIEVHAVQCQYCCKSSGGASEVRAINNWNADNSRNEL